MGRYSTKVAKQTHGDAHTPPTTEREGAEEAVAPISTDSAAAAASTTAGLKDRVEPYVAAAKEKVGHAFDSARERVEPYVEAAKTRAEPYVERASHAVEATKARVDGARGSVASAVEAAKTRAEPYVERASHAVGETKARVDGARDSVTNAVEAAKTRAEPYVEATKARVDGAHKQATHLVETTRARVDGAVEATKTRAEPYVESARAAKGKVGSAVDSTRKLFADSRESGAARCGKAVVALISALVIVIVTMTRALIEATVWVLAFPIVVSVVRRFTRVRKHRRAVAAEGALYNATGRALAVAAAVVSLAPYGTQLVDMVKSIAQQVSEGVRN